MPLARLITNRAEDAEELAIDLRGRGFVVEIVSPELIPSHRADFEIRVEECSAEQALRSAEALSKTEDVHVFIAPGAIIETLRPVKMVSLVQEPPVVVAEVEPVIDGEPVISVAPDQVLDVQNLSSSAEAEVVPEAPLPAEVPSEIAFAEMQKVVSEPLPAQDVPAVEEPIMQAIEGEEIYPPSDWPIWRPLENDGEPQAELVPVAIEGQFASVAAVSPKPVVSASRARGKDLLFWRVATAASVLAVSALVLGVSAHRFSPIPKGLGNSSEQRLPFTGGKVAAQDPAAAPSVVNSKPAPTAELKRVVARVPVVERPSPAEHLTKHVERPKRVQHAATRHEDDYVADDTVIRYGKKKPAAPRVEAQKRSSIKHYSDLR